MDNKTFKKRQFLENNGLSSIEVSVNLEENGKCLWFDAFIEISDGEDKVSFSFFGDNGTDEAVAENLELVNNIINNLLEFKEEYIESYKYYKKRVKELKETKEK